MIIVDTDVLIDALQGREPMATRIARGIRAGGLGTTAISRFELLSGARTERARADIETVLAAIPVFDFDEAAASAAADIRLDLESQGRGIGMADYLIAGICVARAGELLTRNVAHFRRVERLRLAPSEADE